MAYNDPMADDGLGTSSDPIAEAIQASSAFTSTSLHKTVDDQARQSRAQADAFGESDDPVIRLARLLQKLELLSPTFAKGQRVTHLPSGVEATVLDSPSPGVCRVEYSPGDTAQHLSIALKAV